MMQIGKICTDFVFLLKSLATNSQINLLIREFVAKLYLNIYVQTIAPNGAFFIV